MKARRCDVCDRETTDWMISVEPTEEGQETVLWCRDAEDCLRAHEAAEVTALGRA